MSASSPSLSNEDPSSSSGQLFPPKFDPSYRRPSTDAGYVSSRSADALLSDIRPTSLEPQALMFLNELLDELLGTILRRSHGLSTERIKTLAVPYVIPLPLSRESISEAELELLSWTESEEGRIWQGTKEKVYASDDVEDVRQRWPLKEAWELMRAITQTYSTFGDRQKNDRSIAGYIKAMESKGGDTREGIVEPAALYLTAIIEYVAEDVLNSLSRVMVNDRMLSQASPKELYAALSHNEVLYEMMKRMKIKKTIENHLASKLRSAPAVSHKHSQSHAVPGPAEAVQRKDLSSSSVALGDSSPPSAQFDSVNPTSSRKISEPAVNSMTSKPFSKGPRPSAEYDTSSSSVAGIKSAPKGSYGKKTGTYIRGIGEDFTSSTPNLRASNGLASQDALTNKGEQQTLANQDQFDKLIQGENTKKMTLTPHALLRSSEDDVEYRLPKTRSSMSRIGSQQNHQRSVSVNGKGPVASELRTKASGKLFDQTGIGEEEMLDDKSDSRPTNGQLRSVSAKSNEQLQKSPSQTYPSSDLLGLFNQPSAVAIDSDRPRSRNISNSSRTTNLSTNDHSESGKGKKSGGLKSFVSKVMGNSSKDTQDSTSSDRSPRPSPVTVRPGPYSRTLKSDSKASTEDAKPEIGLNSSGPSSPVMASKPGSLNRDEPPSVPATSQPAAQSSSAIQSSAHSNDIPRTVPAVSGQSLLVPNKSFRFDRVPAPSIITNPSSMSTYIAPSKPGDVSEPVSPTDTKLINKLSDYPTNASGNGNSGREMRHELGLIPQKPASVQPSPHLSDPKTPSAHVAAVQTSPSSIPLTEVAQLREILTHATTADECRLLVNALLGSWKVPHISLNTALNGTERASPRELKAHMADQIGQVYEWFLDGERA